MLADIYQSPQIRHPEILALHLEMLRYPTTLRS